MAQPLTLLRSYFHLMQTDGGLRSQLLLDDAAAGVEHLCSLFQIMQDLLQVQSVAAQVASVPFSLVLASLLEDAEVVLAGTGLQLGLGTDCSHEQLFSAPLRVDVDLKRTRQALISMLHVARQGAGSSAVISCSLDLEGCFVEVGLKREDSLSCSAEQHLDEVARLHLGLANANSISQQEIFSMKSSPLRLSVKLPITPDSV